jgi:hypothetical protein
VGRISRPIDIKGNREGEEEMTENKNDGWIRLLVKYKGKCMECGHEIATGEYALWSRNSKVIKHINCGTLRSSSAKKQQELKLFCFICGKTIYGSDERNYESNCGNSVSSQTCICDSCIVEKDVYEKYQQAFLKRMHKVAKVKI